MNCLQHEKILRRLCDYLYVIVIDTTTSEKYIKSSPLTISCAICHPNNIMTSSDYRVQAFYFSTLSSISLSDTHISRTLILHFDEFLEWIKPKERDPLIGLILRVRKA